MRLAGLAQRCLFSTVRLKIDPPQQLFRTTLHSRAPQLRQFAHHCRAMSVQAGQEVSLLGQTAAQQLDEDLMGPLGFSVDQLMELAGLSVASAIIAEFPPTTHPRVLVLAGPGNNGGDGLVAARHLHHFGYSVSICYPRRTDRPLYHGLVTQCRSLGLPFIDTEEALVGGYSSYSDIVVDALFGFSFKGAPRPPFDALIAAMTPPASPPVVVAVDVPSGWDVEGGNVDSTGLAPDMLVSLTAPKLCARAFTGKHHYLGGRFVPPEIVTKYGLKIPRYPGAEQCVKLGGAPAAPPSVADMRISYSVGALEESTTPSDPWALFAEWFEAAKDCKAVVEPNAMALASVDAHTGAPSQRFLLMKGFGPRGVTFYTNYDSRKGGELEANPRAAVAFWWPALERQVRFEGSVERVPAEESDSYWNSRPWGHQVGGLASRQSSVIPGGRPELEAQLEAAQAAHPESEGPVPRPAHWGGYCLRPERVEFWQGRASRLHDRLRYSKDQGAKWKRERLAP